MSIRPQTYVLILNALQPLAHCDMCKIGTQEYKTVRGTHLANVKQQAQESQQVIMDAISTLDPNIWFNNFISETEQVHVTLDCLKLPIVSWHLHNSTHTDSKITLGVPTKCTYHAHCSSNNRLFISQWNFLGYAHRFWWNQWKNKLVMSYVLV